MRGCFDADSATSNSGVASYGRNQQLGDAYYRRPIVGVLDPMWGGHVVCPRHDCDADIDNASGILGGT